MLEHVAALLEVTELIEAGARRREQHRLTVANQAVGRADGCLEGLDHFQFGRPSQCSSELLAGLSICHHAATTLQERQERVETLSFVPPSCDQHERSIHSLQGNPGGRDIRGFRIVDPQHAIDFSYSLEPVRQRPQLRDRRRDLLRRDAGGGSDEQGSERVFDIVIAEERHIGPVDDHPVTEHESTCRAVPPRFCVRARTPCTVLPSATCCQPLDAFVVAVQDPHRFVGGIAKEQLLVRIISVDTVIPVEMIRRKIGENADGRRQAGRIVQLERRRLHDHPLQRWCAVSQSDQRQADVAGRLNGLAGGAQQMGYERCGRRLAVGSRHHYEIDTRESPRRDIQLGDYLNAGATSCSQRRGVRGNPWGHDDCGTGADPLQVVEAQVYSHRLGTQGLSRTRQLCSIVGI